MMPVYRYMDSYSHQGTPVSSGQNFYPSIEAFPPHTKFDPSKPVIINQPWPYPNNFNYCVPCYPYSSDPHFPGYYSHGGFYPHPPMPQFHCCGHQYHPPFPGSLPQFVPPPYYLKEMPRYEFDKPGDNGQHCCGCPNHSHNQNSGGGVRIEEQEPNVGQSLVPAQRENFSHPVLLIPPEYMKNNEQRKHLESDGATQEKSLREMRPQQNVKSREQAPREKYSWFPIDMKSLQSLLQGDNGRRTQQKDEDNVKQFPIDMKSLQSLLQGDNGRRTQEKEEKDEDNMKQFPVPIIWMTPNQKQGEGDKEEKGKIDGFPAIIKDAVHGDSASPAKLLNNGRETNEAREIHQNASANTEPREKRTTQKIIPVKPMEVPKEREISEGAERRGRTVSPKNKSDSEMENSSGASSRRDTSSPPKSKLPPVCLRVDPLPRKKSSSASSRLPSPPASKGKLQEKGQTHQDSEVARESTPSSKKAVEEKHSSGAATQAEERKRVEKKDEERTNDFTGIPVVPLADSSDRKTQQNENVKSTAEGNKGSESGKESTMKQANEKKETNNVSGSTNAALEGDEKKLSVDEAAIRIQSAYRAYQVRKWEPMKKLKQIAEVREKMMELKNKIYNLESYPDLQKDEKQTAVIGEMIMRQLLKLDTIQGLHPSFRDVRKSLARELVMLQEKLDSLHKAICTEKPSDDQEGKSGDSDEHSIEGMPQLANVTLKNQDEETCNPPCAIEAEQKETVNDVQIVDKAQNSPSNELKEVVDNGELNSSMEVEQMEETVQEDKTDSASSESGLSTKVDESGDSAQVVEIVNELPIGVVEDEESQQHKQAGSPNSGDSAQVVEIINELPIGVIEDKESQQHKQAGLPNSGDSAQVVEIVNELPTGVIEDEESQHQKQAGLPNDDGLLLDEVVREKSAADALEGLVDFAYPNEAQHHDTTETSPEETQQDSALLPEDVTADEVQKEVNQETNNTDESSISEAVNAVDVPISDKSESTRDDVFESKRESSPLISTSDKLSIQEEEGKKLAEENEKMREMVKKLLESGKEESAVISNLTGRLNELEQKLKQRKTKGRRHRRVISSPSRIQKPAVTAEA